MTKRKRGRPRKYCVDCREEKELGPAGRCYTCYHKHLRKRKMDAQYKEYSTLLKTIDKSEEILVAKKRRLEDLIKKQQDILLIATKQLAEIEYVLGDEAALDPSLLNADGSAA